MLPTSRVPRPPEDDCHLIEILTSFSMYSLPACRPSAGNDYAIFVACDDALLTCRKISAIGHRRQAVCHAGDLMMPCMICRLFRLLSVAEAPISPAVAEQKNARHEISAPRLAGQYDAEILPIGHLPWAIFTIEAPPPRASRASSHAMRMVCHHEACATPALAERSFPGHYAVAGRCDDNKAIESNARDTMPHRRYYECRPRLDKASKFDASNLSS